MTTLETKKYDVNPFSSLHIGGPGKVYLRQGDQPELTIEAPENVFEALEVTNEAGKLSIRLRPSNFFRWLFDGGKLNIKDEITYHITVTEIEKEEEMKIKLRAKLKPAVILDKVSEVFVLADTAFVSPDASLLYEASDSLTTLWTSP